MKHVALTALSSVAVLLAACTWVRPTHGGDAVRVAYDGNVTGCRDAGAISVSVADKVGIYHRPELKVRDELETLARNQAADIPADTIKPTSEPREGEQKFEAYVCGRTQAHRRDVPSGEAQTYPVKDH